MKFYKKMRKKMVPEWEAKYTDYKALKVQVKKIKEAALDLAKSYASIRSSILSR